MGSLQRVAIGLPIIFLVGGVSIYGVKVFVKKQKTAHDIATIKRLTAQLEAEGFKLKREQFYDVAPPSNKAGMAPVHIALDLLAKESLLLKKPKGSPSTLEPSNPEDEAVIRQNLAVLKPGILAFCKAAIDPKAIIPFDWNSGSPKDFGLYAAYKSATRLIVQLGIEEADTLHPKEALRDFQYGEQLAETVGRQPSSFAQLVAMAQRTTVYQGMIDSLFYEGKDVPYLDGGVQILDHFQTEDFNTALQGDTTTWLSNPNIFIKHRPPVTGQSTIDPQRTQRIILAAMSNAIAVFPVYREYPTDLYQQALHVRNVTYSEADGTSFLNADLVQSQESEIARKRCTKLAFLLAKAHALTGKWPTHLPQLSSDQFVLDPTFTIELGFKSGSPILSLKDALVLTYSIQLGKTQPKVDIQWIILGFKAYAALPTP